MSIVEFGINITPKEAYNILNHQMSADLVFEDMKSINDNMEVIVLIFEKYYFRAENRAALTVILDNVDGVTTVKAIAAGSSKGMLFDFDWGAGDNFAESVRKTLKDFVI